MREAGFDLAVFDNYSAAVQREARKEAIRVAMEMLNWAFWEQTGEDLKDLSTGVYAIRLSGGIEVQYEKGSSPLIYIGEGNVFNRLKQHYEQKLFDFMASLNGANFDFFICEPWKKHYRNTDIHCQVEHDLLVEFAARYGGLSERYCYPLMNKIAGSNRRVEFEGDWWKRPLYRYGPQPSWTIRPLAESGFVGALD